MKQLLVYVANRLWLVLMLYVVSLTLGATCFAWLEGKTLWDGLWWAIVTALTIGYGDLVPATTGGRLMGMFLGHFWIFLIIPMIVANIVVHLLEDKHLFSDTEQEDVKARLKRIEALLEERAGNQR